QRKPHQGGGFLIGQGEPLAKQLGDLAFLARFGLETGEQCKLHSATPWSDDSRMEPSSGSGGYRRSAIEGSGRNAIIDIVLAMKISVLALDNVFDTGLATVLDAFQTANELAALSGLTSPRFDVTVVGVRKNVKTSQGFTVPVRPASTRVPECVVV